MSIDATDRRIVAATQGGLPLVPEPYAAVAAELGLPEAELCARLRRMQAAGIIRRIAAAPNHYALGLVANGMSVWDVDDAALGALGPRVGELDFVSHCYERPRALPGLALQPVRDDPRAIARRGRGKARPHRGAAGRRLPRGMTSSTRRGY